jgi:hypothetical protein
MFRWPRKPHLPPRVEAELELRGVDSVRAYLAGQGSFAGEGTARHTPYRLGRVKTTRGEVEDWLRWKNAADARWVKVAAVAAVVGAVAAIFGAVFTAPPSWFRW